MYTGNLKFDICLEAVQQELKYRQNPKPKARPLAGSPTKRRRIMMRTCSLMFILFAPISMTRLVMLSNDALRQFR